VRAPISLVLALSLSPALGCGRPCPSGRFCGVATWVSGADEPIVEGAAFVLVAHSATDVSLGPFVQPEQLALRPRAVSLRFDVRSLRSRAPTVERATLLLAPHPQWQTLDRSVRVAVQAAGAAGLNGEVEALPDLTATATVPLAMRAPVRIDVTRAVRAWWDGSTPQGSLALSADQEGMVVQGAAAIEPRDRPRIEVVVR
jgi:hypothetical protein